MLANLCAVIEYLCGERDDAPPLLSGRWTWLARCAVWAVAILLIYAFSGQSSKFIYIDF
ncbi:hypothetical protein [Acidicapsa dinghuensis]|uniref:hypothetical protein n=1 Tax=Acidicapsa dinghuensis TaxID=2218256 RepID=UPI00366B9E49